MVNYIFCLRNASFRSMKMLCRASEMAQSVKMFALKPDLSLIPEAHMVEGEN